MNNGCHAHILRMEFRTKLDRNEFLIISTIIFATKISNFIKYVKKLPLKFHSIFFPQSNRYFRKNFFK